LADKSPQNGDILSGLLVSKDYSYTLLDPRDLRDFAGLTTCTVTQRQKIVLGVGWNLVKWHLEGMYGSVEEGLDKDDVPTMRVSLFTFDTSQKKSFWWLPRLWELWTSSILIGTSSP
jgi:cleavage and polyadenylation specificity factor subunit 3